MIESQTLDICCDHMWRVAGNKKINFLPNTALSEIVSTLSVDGVGKESSRDDILNYVNDVEEHTVCMTQVKELGVRAVRQLSSLIKNTINPHIRSVLKGIETYEPTRDGFGRKVTPFKLDSFLLNGLVTELVEKYRNVPVSGSTLDNGVGTFDLEYILSMLNTTAGGDDMSQWQWETDSDTTLGAIQAILAGKHDFDRHPNPIIHAAVLVVLAGTKVPPPDTASNLAVWELNRNRLMTAASQKLHTVIEGYRMAERSQRLYANKYDNDGKEIVVYANVYKAMLEKGLTVEAVIGNEMLNRKFMSHQILDPEVIKICEAKYRQERTAYDVAQKKMERTIQHSYLRSTLLEDLNKIADKESWPVDGDNREKAQERLKSVLYRILDNERLANEPIEDIVAAVLLATWYAHTDAARLIDIASRVCREDPTLNAEEAFTLAKIEYVGVWVASQMRVA